MPVLVRPHASRALWPMITNGAPGRVTPATSRPRGDDVHLVPDRRHLHGQVRVVGQQRPARRRARRRRRPSCCCRRRAPSTSSHSSPGGNGGVVERARGRRRAAGRRLARRGASAATSAPARSRSRIVGAPAGHDAHQRLASAAPMARVSRPRTSSPRRFSARRQDSSRATDERVDRRPRLRRQSRAARNSGGRRQRPICRDGGVHAAA